MTLHIAARDMMQFDAVGNFCRQVAHLGRGLGYEVTCWAENSNIAEQVAPIAALAGQLKSGDVVFYNHSIYDPHLNAIAAATCPKLYYFHNITPPDLFGELMPEVAENCRKGLEQRDLAENFDVLVANSQHSAQILRNGMTDGANLPQMTIEVIPPLIRTEAEWPPLPSAPAPGDSQRHFLCVGRITPHKGHFDLLETFHRLAQTHDNVALDIVGGPAEGEFVSNLKELASAITSETGLSIRFFHDISDTELARLYRQAFSCVSFSRHEGYCVPALDALAYGKPILSTPLPAVHEITGGSLPQLIADDAEGSATILAHALADRDFAQAHAISIHRALSRQKKATDGSRLAQILQSMAGRS